MPLTRYALIIGKLGGFVAERDDEKSPHFKVDIQAGNHTWRAAINVKSRRWPSQVAYCRIERFLHPILPAVAALPHGLHPIRYYPKAMNPNRELALDYIRDDLFDVKALRPIPAHLPGHNNDIMDFLATDVIETRQRDGQVFVWGEPYNNRGHRGIHNIHQNQGNSSRYRHQNGVDQDGAILFWTGETTIAYFISFQSQTYVTQARSGISTNGDQTIFDLLCRLDRASGLQ